MNHTNALQAGGECEMTYLEKVEKAFQEREARLEKRIAELEARECRLLTKVEFSKIYFEWIHDQTDNFVLGDSVQRKFAEANGWKVKS